MLERKLHSFSNRRLKAWRWNFEEQGLKVNFSKDSYFWMDKKACESYIKACESFKFVKKKTLVRL